MTSDRSLTLGKVQVNSCYYKVAEKNFEPVTLPREVPVKLLLPTNNEG